MSAFNNTPSDHQQEELLDHLKKISDEVDKAVLRGKSNKNGTSEEVEEAVGKSGASEEDTADDTPSSETAGGTMTKTNTEVQKYYKALY